MSLSKGRKTVLLANILGDEGKNILAEHEDITCIEFANTISLDEFRLLLENNSPVNGVILGLTPFGKSELKFTAELQVVSRIGVGFDTVDIRAMSDAGIPVMVCANGNHRAVAEHTLGFMLSLAKRFSDLHKLVVQQCWNQRYDYLPQELEDSKVLIIGYGRIGKRVGELCSYFGMEIYVYDPYVKQVNIPDNVNFVKSLDEVLSKMDFVTLHCPKNEETIGMFSEHQLSLMKSSAFLINTARGGIVDEYALYNSLVEHKISGAAIDVFLTEPLSKSSSLLELDNVLYSPHLSGVSRQAVSRMAVLAARNVIDVFESNVNMDCVVNPDVLNKRI